MLPTSVAVEMLGDLKDSAKFWWPLLKSLEFEFQSECVLSTPPFLNPNESNHKIPLVPATRAKKKKQAVIMMIPPALETAAPVIRLLGKRRK